MHGYNTAVWLNTMPTVINYNTERFLPSQNALQAVAVCNGTQLSRSASFHTHFYKFWSVRISRWGTDIPFFPCMGIKSKSEWRITWARISHTIRQSSQPSVRNLATPASLQLLCWTKLLSEFFKNSGNSCNLWFFSKWKNRTGRQKHKLKQKLDTRMQS